MIDFGGDQYTFHCLNEAAEKTGRAFRFLSLHPDDAWSWFDFMQALTPLSPATVPMATNAIHGSFGTDLGEGYPKAYWGRLGYTFVSRTIRSFVADGTFNPTSTDFLRRLVKSGERTRLQDLNEAQLVAEQLLDYPQLQPNEWAESAIDPGRAINEGEVIYGFLPVLQQPGARTIGALIVWAFVAEAVRRRYEGRPQRRLFIICEEFAQIAGAKLWEDVLLLARKFGIHLILTNQSSDSLKAHQPLYSIVYDNTALKLWLTPYSKEDIETLQNRSRDELKSTGVSKGYRSGTSSVSMRNDYEPRLEANEIREAAGKAFEGFMMINDGQGHKDPIHFRFTPECSADEHRRLSNLPLPKRARPVDIPIWGSPTARDDVDRTERQIRLDALLELKRGQEIWK
jgi:hypothetical protein